jgi:hypothetical protein
MATIGLWVCSRTGSRLFRSSVLFKHYGDFENVAMSAGLLPQSVYLGERPPVLPDYLDDSVSARVSLPVQQKIVIVQAIETWITG